MRFWHDEFIADSDDSSNGVEIDLTPAFVGQASSVRRAFAFHPKRRNVWVRDEIKGARPGSEIRWAMVTSAQITISEDASGSHAELRQNGKTLRAWAANVNGEKRIFEIIPAEASLKNDYDAPNPKARILIVRAKASATGEATIFVSLTAKHKS